MGTGRLFHPTSGEGFEVVVWEDRSESLKYNASPIALAHGSVSHSGGAQIRRRSNGNSDRPQQSETGLLPVGGEENRMVAEDFYHRRHHG